MMKIKKIAQRAGQYNANQIADNSTTTIDADNLKAAIDPAEFYQSNNGSMPEVKRSGWVNGGLCPFHLDNKPGSYRINTETGAFKCFSCGTSGGDVIAYEMVSKRVSFQDALHSLADEYHVADKAYAGTKRPFTAREALLTLTKEASIITLAASDIVHGRKIDQNDLDRISQAWNRLQKVCMEIAGV